jgi:tetratricopeptide (TPR) repeat protein
LTPLSRPLASVASLYLYQKKWDEAEAWYEKLVAVDPNNADAYYSLGFIAWSKLYPIYGRARVDLGMKQDDPGPIKDKTVREQLRAKWLPTINAGLKALDLADSLAEYNAQIQVADGWLQKGLQIKEAKEARKKK